MLVCFLKRKDMNPIRRGDEEELGGFGGEEPYSEYIILKHIFSIKRNLIKNRLLINCNSVNIVY